MLLLKYFDLGEHEMSMDGTPEEVARQFQGQSSKDRKGRFLEASKPNSEIVCCQSPVNTTSLIQGKKHVLNERTASPLSPRSDDDELVAVGAAFQMLDDDPNSPHNLKETAQKPEKRMRFAAPKLPQRKPKPVLSSSSPFRAMYEEAPVVRRLNYHCGIDAYSVTDT